MANIFTRSDIDSVIRYIDSKMNSDVRTFAIETEYPAGTYHIAIYRAADIKRFVNNLSCEDFGKLFRDHDGLRLRPLTVGEDNAKNRNSTKNAVMFRFVHDLPLETIYSQEGRIKMQDVERITAEILDGKENGRRKNHAADVVNADGYGKIECKGMGGKLSD